MSFINSLRDKRGNIDNWCLVIYNEYVSIEFWDAINFELEDSLDRHDVKVKRIGQGKLKRKRI